MKSVSYSALRTTAFKDIPVFMEILKLSLGLIDRKYIVLPTAETLNIKVPIGRAKWRRENASKPCQQFERGLMWIGI